MILKTLNYNIEIKKVDVLSETQYIYSTNRNSITLLIGDWAREKEEKIPSFRKIFFCAREILVTLRRANQIARRPISRC